MKNIPNIITGLRIIFSFLLLFLEPVSVLFLIVYFICGLSDFLDGFIARKCSFCSKFGSVFDSIADLIFVGVALFIFIPILTFPVWFLFWIVAIAAVKIVSVVIGFIKFKKLALLHTYANKTIGAILFLFPLFYRFLKFDIIAIILCSFASVAALEEILINLTAKKLDVNIKSTFLFR